MTPFPYSVDMSAAIGQARALMLEHHVHHLPVTHDGRPSSYSFAIETASSITGLRLDPSQAAGEGTIESIALRSASGEVLRKWTFR